MQNLSNNMDDLFRKAAAGYPLKTDNSDWDGLASRLSASAVTPGTGKKRNWFNKYGPFLLLLVLMLVLGDGLLKQPLYRTATFPLSSAKKETGTTAIRKQQHSQQPLINKLNRNVTSNTSPIINDAPVLISGRRIGTIRAYDLTYNTGQLVGAGNIISAGTGLPSIAEAKEMVNKNDSLNKRPALYWGIVFGPGINQIKKQKVRKTGFDIGIMAGISILKGRAAVETGLLYTQKYYFSDGKYFDMDKGGGSMPQGMEIMSLEGSSRLFEIPVKFKYRVFQKNRSGIFLSTGISSYLMTREENNYQAMMNGIEQNMVGMYTNSKRYIAVTANVGAEFNYKTGKHTRISIEPYFQIPLKGIGIGSMPVMTSGIHIGFMRSAP